MSAQQFRTRLRNDSTVTCIGNGMEEEGKGGEGQAGSHSSSGGSARPRAAADLTDGSWLAMNEQRATEILSYRNDDDLPIPGVHLRAELDHDTRPIPMPLCWIAEGSQRGATVAEWLVSIDHEALPAATVTTEQAAVDCRECLEWMHA